MFEEEPDTKITEARGHLLVEDERDTDVEVPVAWAMRSELAFPIDANSSEVFLEACRLTGTRVLAEGARVLFFGEPKDVGVLRRFLEEASELENVGLSVPAERIPACLELFRQRENASLLDGLDWLVPAEGEGLEASADTSREKFAWPPEETLH